MSSFHLRSGVMAALLSMLALHSTPCFAQTIAIARGSFWKFDTTGTDLGTDWRDPFYSDGVWGHGNSPLGYGDSSVVTPLPYGPDPGHRRPTQYLRRSFNVTVPPSTVRALTLDANYDDGFVVYLNGVEVARRSMPAGTVGYDSLAFDHPSGVFEAIDLNDATTLLVQGSNYLAVELHHAAPDDSTLLWNADVTYATVPLLTRGPYLQLGTSTEVTVRWRTNFATDSKVRYGTATGGLVATEQSGVLTTEHEMVLSGLAPDTRYFYSVETSSVMFEGDDAGHSFVTAPSPGASKPTRLWAIGDAGTGNTIQKAVRDAYTTYASDHEADLWLMLGDNAYVTGSDAEYQANVFDIYTSLLKKMVVWPTRGNHDNLFAPPGSDYYGIFDMPTAGQAGGLASGTEAYYSLDYSNIHLICLDSEGSDRTPGGAMLTWLQNDLAATNQDWIIAFWHHPPYTHGSHNSDNDLDSQGKMGDMRRNALPILEAGGVDLVLSGHSHDYERSMLLDGHYDYSWTLTPAMKPDSGDGRPNGDGAYMKAHLRAPHEGAVYAVNGSSGGRSETPVGALDHPAMITSMLVYGSMIIDVDGLKLDARFVDDSAVVRDSFEIVKGTTTGVRRGGPPKGHVSLAAARPNPFGTEATIAYSIPRRGAVKLSILDLGGRRVRTLVSGEQAAGSHQAVWNGRSDRGGRLGAGVYFSVLEFQGASAARKLILMK